MVKIFWVNVSFKFCLSTQEISISIFDKNQLKKSILDNKIYFRQCNFGQKIQF